MCCRAVVSNNSIATRTPASFCISLLGATRSGQWPLFLGPQASQPACFCSVV
jgi:hypothetical protein